MLPLLASAVGGFVGRQLAGRVGSAVAGRVAGAITNPIASQVMKMGAAQGGTIGKIASYASSHPDAIVSGAEALGRKAAPAIGAQMGYNAGQSMSNALGRGVNFAAGQNTPQSNTSQVMY